MKVRTAASDAAVASLKGSDFHELNNLENVLYFELIPVLFL